jgi:hypothetical protein
MNENCLNGYCWNDCCLNVSCWSYESLNCAMNFGSTNYENLNCAMMNYAMSCSKVRCYGMSLNGNYYYCASSNCGCCSNANWNYEMSWNDWKNLNDCLMNETNCYVSCLNYDWMNYGYSMSENWMSYEMMSYETSLKSCDCLSYGSKNCCANWSCEKNWNENLNCYESWSYEMMMSCGCWKNDLNYLNARNCYGYSKNSQRLGQTALVLLL